MTNIMTRKTAIIVFWAVAVLFCGFLLINTPRVSALSCNNCVNGGDIVNGSITSSDLGTNSVGLRAIIANGVGAAEISAGAVGTSEITNNSVTSTDLADDITVSTLVADTIFVTDLFNAEFLNLGSSVVTDIPDNGNGATAATFTLDSLEAYAYLGLNCQDANGCNVTLGNDFFDGDVMTVYNAGTNAVNFADTSGVSELAGAFAMGQWDTLQLIYRDNDVTDAWIETSRSNN